MKKSVQKRHVLMAVIAVGTVLISGVPDAFAQKLTYRQAQYQQSPYEMGGPAMGPAVDLPPPRSEASVLPSMDDVVPPSLQQQPTASGVVGPGYESYGTAPYSEPIMDGVPTMGQMMVDGTPDEVAQAGLEPIGYCGDDGPAPIFSTGSWWWRGNWYTQMDVVVLDRSDPRQRGNIIIDPQIVGFTENDLAKLNYTPGTRLTLGKFLGRDASSRDHMVEFSFLGLFDWDAGRTLTSDAPLGMGTLTEQIFSGTNDLFSPFRGGDRQTYQYSTDLNDFQLNYRLQTRPGKDVMALQPNGMWVQHAQAGQVRSLLMGMRASSIDEEVDYSTRTFGQISRDDVTTATTTIQANGSSRNHGNIRSGGTKHR